MKLKKAIIALYQKIVTVLYLYSYTNLSFQEVMLLWQRITAMIWMRPEIPRTNMTTEARTAVRTAPRTRARTITRTRPITRRKTIVRITVTNSVVGPFPVMDRKWAFYIWYSKKDRGWQDVSDCKYASAGMVDTEEHAHVPDRRQGSGKL